MREKNLPEKLIGVLPAYIVLSLIGCGLALACGVPADHLPIVVAVPMSVLFVFSRLIIRFAKPMTLTEEEQRTADTLPLGMKVFGVFGAVSLALSVTALLSAIIYSRIQLPESAHYALRQSGIGLLAFALAFTGVTIGAAVRATESVVRPVAVTDTQLMWKLASFPSMVFACLHSAVSRISFHH